MTNHDKPLVVQSETSFSQLGFNILGTVLDDPDVNDFVQKNM
jgi:hypothetical protein